MQKRLEKEKNQEFDMAENKTFDWHFIDYYCHYF